MEKKISRRDFIKTGAGGVAALVLARCATATEAPTEAPGEAPEEAPGEAPPAEAVTVNFLAWGDPADIEAWDKLKNLYEEQNPNVTIEVTTVADPNVNFYPKLQTMIAGGTPPHVASFQGWEWQTYADQGVLAPIDDYVAANSYFSKVFPEGIASITDSTVRDGKLYLIPMQIGTMVMFYAKKHFDDAGIPYPTEEWTFDEFLSLAEQMTDTSGDVKKFGYQANGSWFRDISWIRPTGQQEFDQLIDPKTAQFSQQEIVDMLQIVASDVYHTLKISPTQADLEGGANTIETGNVAMKYEGAWFFGRLNSPELRAEGKQVEFDVVAMPLVDDPERPTRGWAEGVALPQSDNVDAGWAFASFMAGEEGDKIYSETTGRIPNNLDLIESFWIPTIQDKFGVENGQAFIDSIKRSEVDVVGGVPRSKMWSEVVKPTGYDPLIAGSASAAELLPKVDSELQAMLDDYWASQ